MELQLTRPLLFFDIETTGLNIATDGIVELCFVKVYPGNPVPEVRTWRIRPWNLETGRQIHISEEASAVNGIKDEDVKDCKRFLELADEIVDMLQGCDLAGYNSGKFDRPMLAEELERVRVYCEKRIADPKTPADKKEKARAMMEKVSIDLHSVQMIDVQTIYHYMEPRNLRAAYRFYCGGEDFDNAHAAEADTLATYEVLKGQLDRYQTPDKYHETVLKNDVDFLSGVGGRPKTVDYAGRIIMSSGVPTINFGKYKGRSVREIYETDKSYFAWIENGEFTLDTKRQFKRLAQEYAQEERQKASKPLEGKDLSDAADLLKNHFGSR